MFLTLSSLALSALKVNELNVRLPYKKKGGDNPSYMLEASEKNVVWETYDNELITVTPIETGSRFKDKSLAKVEVIYEGNDKQAAVIHAKTRNEAVEINVFIDKISRAELQTTTRVLYCNSSIDRFKIVAFDSSGNRFNSIDQYDIKWDYVPSQVKAVSIRNTDLFSKYEGGLPPSEILLQGTDIGKTSISATIDGGITTESVELDIVFPIYLFPGEVNVLKGTQFKGRLCSKLGFDNNRVMDDCYNEIDITLQNYLKTSDNEGLVKINEDGVVSAEAIGSTQIRVIDQKMPLSKAHMIVHVCDPKRATIEDQWLIVGEKVSFKSAKIYNARDELLVIPSDLEWTIKGDYSHVGTHYLKATTMGVTAEFKVVVCNPLRFKKPEIHLPLGYSKDYVPLLTGGSGEYDVAGEVDTTTEGSYKLVAQDRRLPSSDTQTVFVEKITSSFVEIPHREFYVGENITYDYVVKGPSGVPFDLIDLAGIEINDTEIAKRDGNFIVTKSVGFVRIEVSVYTAKVSAVVGVFKHLTADTLVAGSASNLLNPHIRGGPLKWEDAGQTRSVRCDNVNAKLTDDLYIIVSGKYNGTCVVSIQNEKTPINPYPLLAEAEIKVTTASIAKFVILSTDSKAEGIDPEFVPKKADPHHPQPPLLYIPSTHHLEVTLHAFSDEDKYLGQIQSTEISLVALDDAGYETDFRGELNTPFTLHVRNHSDINQQFEAGLRIVPIRPLEVSGNRPVIVSRIIKEGEALEVIGGSGNFSIHGTGCNLTERSLVILPTRESNRTVKIVDNRVREYQVVIDVVTDALKSLKLSGPSFGIVNERLVFECTATTVQGYTLAESVMSKIKFSHEPKDLIQINGTHWEYTCDHPMQLDVIMKAFNHDAKHIVHVSDRLVIQDTEFVMFVGERQLITTNGGSSFDIKYSSEDEDVVTMDGATAVAHKVGRSVVTAFAPAHPEVGTANVTIRVIEVRGIRLERSTDEPIVGAIIHVSPYMITDDGEIPPRLVEWDISGAYNSWYRLYDNSIIIHAHSRGNITVRCAAYGHIGSEVLTIDEKLCDRVISLPVGSTFKYRPQKSLPVSYKIVNVDDSEGGCTIDPSGLITAKAPGRYHLMIQYRSQWCTVPITVSIPTTVFLEAESTSTLHPILLDKHGLQYTSTKGASYDFNVTEFIPIKDGRYRFTVAEPTYIKVTASNDGWQRENITVAYKHQLIAPESPILVQGSSASFVCSERRVNWRSSNPRVLPIDPTGQAIALKRGFATVHCSDNVQTPVRVAQFHALEIRESAKLERYEIEHVIDEGAVDAAFATFPKDHRVRCEWDAPDCGAIYAVDARNVSASYCHVELRKAHLCQPEIHVTVTAESSAYGRVTGVYTIRDIPNIWGMNPLVNVSVSKSRPEVHVPIAIDEDELLTDITDHLNLTFVEADPGIGRAKGIIISADMANFKTPGRVELTHEKTGEMMRIEVFPERSNWVSFWRSGLPSALDKALSQGSVIITCIIGFILAYRVGSGGLLPPLSPYKMNN